MRKWTPNIRSPNSDDLGLSAAWVGIGSRLFWIYGVKLGATFAIALSFGLALSAQAQSPAPTVSFQKQVYPIFENYHCLQCHSPSGIGEIASGLDLSTYKGLRQGSAQGVAIVPRFSDRSPMMRLLNNNWDSGNTESLRMPPMGPRLSAQDLKTITDWIDQGARDN